MNIDLSTITPIGLFALLVVCGALTIIFIILLKAVKTLRVKTEKATIEIGKSTEKINETVRSAKDSGMNVSPDIVKKQSNLAKHHIMDMRSDLEKVIYKKYVLTPEEKSMAHLMLSLFLSELKYQVLNNFTENHIGNNDIEIREYSKIREREYVAFARTFVSGFSWLFPNHNVLEFFDDIPDGYLEYKLFTIFKDGKDLEKNHIKGGI